MREAGTAPHPSLAKRAGHLQAGSWSMSCRKSSVIQNDCGSQAAEKTLKEVRPFKQKDVHLKILFQANTH